MDTETLKELIAAFQELGGEAKEAFVWYLLVTHGLGKLIWLLWTVIGGVTILGIFRLVREWGREEQITGNIFKHLDDCWCPRTIVEARTVLSEYFENKYDSEKVRQRHKWEDEEIARQVEAQKQRIRDGVRDKMKME